MAAAFEVYNELGRGFTEEVYQEALELELSARNIPFLTQESIVLSYKGTLLKRRFVPDLIVSENIIVELKAVSSLHVDHEAQLLNYLKASDVAVGYLVNFGCVEKLEWKRFVRTHSKKSA